MAHTTVRYPPLSGHCRLAIRRSTTASPAEQSG